MIKVGAADASTLTVGATCHGVPNAGVRNAGPVVGKLVVPPLVVVFVVEVSDDDEGQQGDPQEDEHCGVMSAPASTRERFHFYKHVFLLSI